MTQYAEAAAHSNEKRIEQLESEVNAHFEKFQHNFRELDKIYQQTESRLEQIEKQVNAKPQIKFRSASISELISDFLIGKFYKFDNELLKIKDVSINQFEVRIYLEDGITIYRSTSDTLDIFES